MAKKQRKASPRRRIPPKPIGKKSARAKSISKGVSRYWKEVRRIADSRKISIASAKNFYRSVERVKPDRFERIVVDSKSKRPRKISAKAFDKFSKKMEGGRDKGKYVVYYDRNKKKVVGGKPALRQRRKLQVERLAFKMLGKPKNEQRFAHKFWPKYALKRGYLTEYESRIVAKKLLAERRKDKNLARRMKEVYDES